MAAHVEPEVLHVDSGGNCACTPSLPSPSLPPAAIEELHLQHNRFKRLPFAVAAASRLRVLRLEGNQGLQLGPAEVVLLTHLPALQELVRLRVCIVPQHAVCAACCCACFLQSVRVD